MTLSGSLLSHRDTSPPIAYNSFGKGAPVLLIHGLFADKEQWTALARLLALHGHRAIVPDLPGYGLSTGFELSTYRLEQQVESLHTFIRGLGIKQLDVAGNSMGGAIAELYAQRYPEEVRTVAFLGAPFGYTPWDEPMREAIFCGTNPFIPTSEAELDVEMGLLFNHPPHIEAQRRKRLLAAYVTQNRHYVQIWDVVNMYDDVLKRTPFARKPTLIVWGREDHVFGANAAQSLQRMIVGSELHQLENAGHLLHLENAAEVARLYAGFLLARRCSSDRQY
jgi:abhydrolase domain-containing protein 6